MSADGHAGALHRGRAGAAAAASDRGLKLGVGPAWPAEPVDVGAQLPEALGERGVAFGLLGDERHEIGGAVGSQVSALPRDRGRHDHEARDHARQQRQQPQPHRTPAGPPFAQGAAAGAGQHADRPFPPPSHRSRVREPPRRASTAG